MAGDSMLGPPEVRRRLSELSERAPNYDPEELRRADPAQGWSFTDRCQTLPVEPPGMPVAGGSWEIARRLMSGYEFADPSIVRAYYDPDVPLEGRNMLLKLQALGVLHLYVGVRVAAVYEQTRQLGDGAAHVWGWTYQTLEGHVESGEMSWEVWKWLASGTVEFRIHSVSRSAPSGNPLVRIGFHLLRGRERDLFLRSTQRRMLELTTLGLSAGTGAEDLRSRAAGLTARPFADDDAAHERLARSLAEER